MKRHLCLLLIISLLCSCASTPPAPSVEPIAEPTQEYSYFTNKRLALFETLRFDKEKPYVRIPDRREAIRYAIANARRGDTVVLAGKGHEKYQLVDGKKLDFSERDIVMRAVAETVSDSKKQYI